MKINYLIDKPEQFTKNSTKGLEKFSYDEIIDKWQRTLMNL